MEGKIVLRYVGKGAFLNGVPARDLTAMDIEERGLDVDALVKSPLYERVSKKRKQARVVASDEVTDTE